MIPMAAVHTTSSPRLDTASRRMLLLGGAALLSGCVSKAAPPGPPVMQPLARDDAFIMADGARLPYRKWLPAGRPEAVVLALHGFNDSRDAWEIPAPDFVAAGLAIYAPDQRGFGAAPGRGLWPGGDALISDAAAMARLVRRRHPGTPLILMGESMGGAVLMCLATRPDAPEQARYVLAAPAVWGRAWMNIWERGGLWLAATLVPGMAVGRPPVRVIASDNYAALVRLSTDPLTIHDTRFDTLRGLVDLMDMALAAAAVFTAPGLFLYGAHDQLVPKDAMRATWRALPRGARFGYYRHGWHLLLRDLDRAAPIGDAIAWIRAPSAPLPSGAEAAAAAWLASAV
jgi:acylglycerol lipase